MKRSTLSIVLPALATVTSHLYAAAPPPFNCAANPLAAMKEAYVFSAQGILPFNYAITGRFVASIGTDRSGAPIGIINVVATTVQNGLVTTGSVTRLETDVGRFQVNANCTGGTIWFNLSSRPISFDFWFFDSREQLYLVSNLPGFPLVGKALIGTLGCPAGITNTLQVLNAPYAFAARGLPPNLFSIAGTMIPSIGVDRANQPLGILNINATSDINGSITRAEGDVGRYTVYPDCSGGQLTHNLSSRPIQYDFWFVYGFNEFYFISTSGFAAVGVATK